MNTPAYNQLTFMQRMAVRHTVLDKKNMAALASEPGKLERALEEIASDPERLKRACADYEYFAQHQPQKITLGH